MGFAPGGVWIMGYRSCMGYGMHFPANQLAGPKKVWSTRENGLSRLWITRESKPKAVDQNIHDDEFSRSNHKVF
jgi:hypothetical protein